MTLFWKGGGGIVCENVCVHVPCVMCGFVDFGFAFGYNVSIADPSVSRFGFNTLPDLQECYSSCISESDPTHISVFFYESQILCTFSRFFLINLCGFE